MANGRNARRSRAGLAVAVLASVMGVVDGSNPATAAVTLTSTCPVVGLGSFTGGEPAGASATTTTLSQPVGVAVDESTGDVFVSERNWDDTGTYSTTGQGRVRRITQAGAITDLPLAPPGERLGRLAASRDGATLYMSSQSTAGYRVLALDLTVPTATWTVYAGGGTDLLGNGVPATTAGFIQIDDIAVSPATDLLYISGVSRDDSAVPDPENVGIVREVDGSGFIRTVVGGLNDAVGSNAEGVPGSTARVAFGPVSLGFNPNGDLNIGSVRLVRRIHPAATTNPYGDGNIVTFAGANGTEDITGDGTTVATARLGGVNALAVDAAGDLYVGGVENHSVRLVSAGGNVSTYVGETGAAGTDAGIAGFAEGNADTSRLAFTQQMAVFGTDLFVADSRNNRIRRVALNQPPSGPSYVTTFAGDGPAFLAGTGSALTSHTGLVDGIATGPDGSVYLADRAAYRVWRASPGGSLTPIAGNGSYRGLVGTVGVSGPATSLPLAIVRDVAIDPATDTLYILERTRVLSVDLTTGTMSHVAGTGAIGQADNAVGALATLDTGAGGSLTLGGGFLYATGSSGNVRRISLATTAVDTPITGLGSGANALSVAADGAAGLFIGTNSHQILYWPNSGAPVVIAGDGVFGGSGDGGPAAASRVGSPNGLSVFDGPGDADVVYFANQGRQIRSISATSATGALRWSSGTIRLVAGNVATTPLGSTDWGDGRDLTADPTLTRFNFPRDTAVDAEGRLYVNDANFPDSNPSAPVATNTGPHMIRVLTDAGCSEARLTAPPTADTATSGAVPLSSLPLGQIAFDTAAIAATPMRAVPMRASELDTTPMRASPMRAVPMRAVPMRASGLANTPMRASSLSAFPLNPAAFPGGWPARLEGTPYAGRLPQTITLAELLDDPTTPGDETSQVLDRQPRITLADIDLSASPMRAVSIASMALGATPMRAVPMRASLIGATDAERFQAWCDLLTDPAVPEISQLGYTCASLGLTQESPLFALDVASVPMRAVPMRAVPMRAVDITGSPLADIPMRASGIEPNPMRASPMRAVPMRAVLINSAPMRAVPLSAIPMRASEIADSPMRAVPLAPLDPNIGDVVTCYPACQTLGEAAEAFAIVPTATLGDLMPALDVPIAPDNVAPRLGDLRFGAAVFAGVDQDNDFDVDVDDEIDLGNIIPALPEEPFISLADVLAGLVATQDLPWEDVGLDAMGVTSLASGATTPVSFEFRLYPGQTTDVPLTVTLPAGWRYASTQHLEVLADGASVPTTSPISPTVSLDAPTSVQTLTYTIPAATTAPSTIEVLLDVHPGNRTGTFQASGTIGPVIPNGASRSVTSAPITVSDPNDAVPTTYDTANAILPDHLYVRHLAADGESDYYRVDAGAPGAVTRISLSHLPVDADLVVYEEDPAQFNFRANVAKLRQQSAPVEMAEPTGKRVGEALEPAQAQDIPTEPGKVVASISAKRGTETEAVELINDNPGVDYVIAVRGYNGVSSPDPYVLRVGQLQPPGSATCTSTDIQLPPVPGGYTTSTAISSLPAGTKTLLLANRERLVRQFGATEATTLLNRIDTFAARPDVAGAVLLVDGTAAVRNAYDAWDLNPCGLGRPNLVVRAINDKVDSVMAASASATAAGLENLVVVGGDEQIPMARLVDNTKLSNEAEYGGELLRNGTVSTPQTVALASKSLMTDDPYASFAPKLFGLDVVYPPDVAMGRLVEDPTEIDGALDQFEANSGRLAPDSALITGYDFLTDGALGVRDALANAVPGTAERDGSLITDTWTAGDLTAKVVTPADAPDITSLNAHFDHHRLLPAEGDQNANAPLFTTDDLASDLGQLNGRVLFSMGCHSGSTASDFYLGTNTADALDWPQLMARQRAIWVANSGYGYGDTEAVAYSERLMELFATRLGDGERTGEALRLAKQDYLGSGIANSYDAKALTQLVHYGLPMYRVGAGTPPVPPPSFVPVVPDPAAAGLPSHALTVTPDLRLSDPGADGSRYVYAFDPAAPTANLAETTQVVDGRPIQPRVDRDVTAAGLDARGAVVTALDMTEQPLTVTVARPTSDSSDREPAIAAPDMAYPSTFQNVTAFDDARGSRNNLVVIPGQWIPDGVTSNAANVGMQRSFTSMGVTVYYASPGDPDDIQPTITATSGDASGGGVTFTAEIGDRTPTGPGTITRASVMYLDGSTWRSTELAPTGGGRFTGGGPAATDVVDYFVQAVDASGNVAVSSNKALMFKSDAAPAPGPGVNGAPVVSAPPTAPGAVFTPVVVTGTFTDPDASTTWSGSVNNGAGQAASIVVSGSGYTATIPAYTTAGTFTATVSLCDGEGACGTALVTVAVAGSAIGPSADCTVLVAGRALTWWGTTNSGAPQTLPIGPANLFSPSPGDRGQPPDIPSGTAPRVFATQDNPATRSSWSLGGTSAAALAGRGCS